MIALGALSLFAASPATAKVTFPISVPPGCFQLAEREGVPTVLENRYQAMKARVKLARLSDRDPLVHQCREAVRQARDAMRAMEQQEKEAPTAFNPPASPPHP